jgi:hypothetical protein
VSAGERGIVPSLPCALSLALALALAACGGPVGSRPPDASGSSTGPADARASVPGEIFTPGASGENAGGASDLGRPGGVELEAAGYSVEEALSAEGGEAIRSMLDSLGFDPDAVNLTLAVGAGGEPTISDWRLPGASADAILGAWKAAAPGTWSPTTLAGLPALAGQALDGSIGWAIALDGRFVYVRTDDLAIAEDVARIIGS